MQKIGLCIAAVVSVSALFWSVNVFAKQEQSVTKVLNLSAHIENKKFFSYKVTKFGFENSDLKVTYNSESFKFAPISTHMIVETDIPLDFASGLEIIPTKLDSQCLSIQGEKVKEGFAHYSLDQQELTRGKITKLSQFNSHDDLYLKDYREFEISFDPIPDVDVRRSDCSGEAILLVSLDF